jgi:hypothetical protein
MAENVVINYSEFFKDDGGFKKVREDFEKLSADLIEQAKELREKTKIIDISNSKEVNELAKTTEKLTEAKRKQVEISKSIEKIEKESLKQKIEAEKLARERIKTTEAQRRATEKASEAEQKSIRSVNQTRKSEIQLSETQRRQKEAIRKASEREQRAADKLNRAYSQLNIQRSDARRIIEDLNAKKVLGVRLSDNEQRELKESTREYQRLDKAIRQIDQANGRFQANVGNYPRLFSSAKNALAGFIGAFGLFQGVRFFADFTRDSFRLANEAKGVEFAFQQIGASARNAFEDVRESTRGLISDLDIKRSLVEFDNFNLSLRQSGILFEFLTLRATQTGRSIDSLRDSLVEGLSKESKLRIDNLGISMSDLNAELAKGVDFIDAVANIAQRELVEAGGILDEAADNTAKWKANLENVKVAFGNLVTSITQGGGVISRIINANLEAAKDFFNFLSRAVKSQDALVDDQATIIAQRNIDQIVVRAEALGKSFEDAAKQSTVIKQIGVEIRGLEKDIDSLLEKQNIRELAPSEQIRLANLREEVEIRKRAIELTQELIDKEIERSKKTTTTELTKEQQDNIDKQRKEQEKAGFEVEKLRREQAIDRLNKEIENENIILAERIKILRDREKLEIELENFIKDQTIKINKLSGNQKVLIEEQTQKKIREIRDQSQKELLSLVSGEVDARLTELNDLEDIEIAKLEQKRKNFKKESDFEEFKQLELLKIQKKFAEKRLELLIATGDDQFKVEIEQLKGLIESLNAQIEGLKPNSDPWSEFVDEVVNAFTQGANVISNKLTQSVIDSEKALNDQQKAVDSQRKRAEQGLQNTLAFEQKEEAKREKELIERQKRLDQINKLTAYWNTYNANLASLEPGQDSTDAITKTLTSIAVIEALTASLTRFADGGVVEDRLPVDGIFRGASHSSKKGGIPIMVEGQEGIFSKKEMANLGKDNFYALKNIASSGVVDGNFFSEQRNVFIKEVPSIGRYDKELVSEIKAVKQAINSRPDQMLNVPEVVNGVLEFT